MNAGKRGRRLDGIDLLRGLAIWFVLMNHVNMRLLSAQVPYTRGLPDQLVSSLVWNGQFGVQMFFAISGFLITSTSIRRWGSLERVRPREFYLLRFARIAPLFFLLLFVLSGLEIAGVRNFVISQKTGGLGTALVAALTFRVNVLEATRGYLPGNWGILWSLSVEEMFYLFFPLACVALRRGKRLNSVLVAFVLAGPFARTVFTRGNEVWREYSYLGAMDAIALGCLTALVTVHTQFSTKQLRTLAGLGTAFVVFILCFSHTAGHGGLRRVGLDMTTLAIGTCMLIAVAAQTEWKRPRLLAPLCWMGERSYEIYLTHMFVVFAVFSVFLRLGKSLRLVPAFFGIVIVVSSLLGYCVARFYSEPANSGLRRRFGVRRGNDRGELNLAPLGLAE